MTACLLGYYYILTSEEYIFVVPAESVPSLLSKFFTRTSKQANERKRECLNVIPARPLRSPRVYRWTQKQLYPSQTRTFNTKWKWEIIPMIPNARSWLNKCFTFVCSLARRAGSPSRLARLQAPSSVAPNARARLSRIYPWKGIIDPLIEFTSIVGHFIEFLYPIRRPASDFLFVLCDTWLILWRYCLSWSSPRS